MKTIKDLDIDGKKVLIRCDFNVPIKDGTIVDDTRIQGALETIKYCLDKNCKIILMSHLGRVKEESDLAKNDLSPVAKRLSELLNQDIHLHIMIFLFLFLWLLRMYKPFLHLLINNHIY